jgi:uncharacterized membrane protein YdbT with pleckstrin-like domain
METRNRETEKESTMKRKEKKKHWLYGVTMPIACAVWYAVGFVTGAWWLMMVIFPVTWALTMLRVKTRGEAAAGESATAPRAEEGGNA